jgi:hypothetical protein
MIIKLLYIWFKSLKQDFMEVIMKKNILLIFLLATAVIATLFSTFNNYDINKSAKAYFIDKILFDDPEINKVSFQQMSAQAYLFHQALNEFGATSPLQVVELWVKADQTRNGVLKYAVSCDNLKKKFIEKRGKADEAFWIIGGSSPWLDRYETVEAKKIGESTYIYTLKYYWTSSLGESEPELFSLTVVRTKGKWCVQQVSDIKNLYTFSTN